MPSFRMTLVFDGVDFDDGDTFAALAALPNVTWRGQGTIAFATTIVDGATPLAAVKRLVGDVRRLVPSARGLRLDDDLVAIPDIAGRVGVTREAVRNWASGKRQQSFPVPRGVVGEAIKVWAWADVNAWLRENLELGDPERFPTLTEALAINDWLSAS